MTHELHPATPEEKLLEEYLEVVERHGLNSRDAQSFRDTHKDTPGFIDLVSLVGEMETAQRKAVWGRRVVAGVWATTAVLVAFIGWIAVQRSVALAAPYWGLNQPNALAELEKSPSAAAFLKGLARVASEGTDSWPEDPIPLAQRITEYRLGCTRLLYADKHPLNNKKKVKEELEKWCRTWSQNLDSVLEELDRKPKHIAPVRSQVNAIVTKIVEKLQDQANKLEVEQAMNAAIVLNDLWVDFMAPAVEVPE